MVPEAVTERVAPAGLVRRTRTVAWASSPHPGGRAMDSHAEPVRYVGIDVGKDRVEVHVRPDPTGGYEAVIAATLSNAGLPVAIITPPQTRQFAGALGRLAKTDTIDASVIAHFAEMAKLKGKPPA